MSVSYTWACVTILAAAKSVVSSQHNTYDRWLNPLCFPLESLCKPNHNPKGWFRETDHGVHNFCPPLFRAPVPVTIISGILKQSVVVDMTTKRDTRIERQKCPMEKTHRHNKYICARLWSKPKRTHPSRTTSNERRQVFDYIQINLFNIVYTNKLNTFHT